VRGLALGLALLLFGCGSDPVLHCTKDPAPGEVRLCAKECAWGQCFQRERAQCFVGSKGPVCSPTAEECVKLLARAGVPGRCAETPADEL
jgi:hypothetical protein